MMKSINSENQLQKLPEDDRQLILSFGTTRPGICESPHCIFSPSAACLTTVSEVTQATLGIWGVWPLVDASGEPYIGPEDGWVIEDFKLWGLKANQTQVSDYGEGYDTSYFSMAIDAYTSHDILKKLYSTGANLDDYDYYFYVSQAAKWMKFLPWAYIPLEWEGRFSLFVAAAENTALVRAVEQQLTAAGHKVFSVVKSGEHFLWEGPLQWPAGR